MQAVGSVKKFDDGHYKELTNKEFEINKFRQIYCAASQLELLGTSQSIEIISEVQLLQYDKKNCGERNQKQFRSNVVSLSEDQGGVIVSSTPAPSLSLSRS